MIWHLRLSVLPFYCVEERGERETDQGFYGSPKLGVGSNYVVQRADTTGLFGILEVLEGI